MQTIRLKKLTEELAYNFVNQAEHEDSLPPESK